MALLSVCQSAFAVLHHIEPIIVLEQLGNCLFDTALQLVVKDRCANISDPGVSPEQSQQKAMADFFMNYNLIIRLVPILPALLLAKLSDRGWRRAPIVVPLGGYLLSRIVLLLVLLFGLPLQLMYGAAALFGVSGGFCAFWPGVMTLVSLKSTATDRSKVMMRVELLYGAAGVVGSLVSGHLFLLYTVKLGQGVILLIVSSLIHLLILILSIVLLQVKQVSEDSHLLSHNNDDEEEDNDAVNVPVAINKVNVVLLFAAAILYDFAVGGAVEILGIFVLKEPLSWTATQVGYGNAAGCTIFLTSFLGVMLFRRCCSDVTLILIGMLSFATGIYFMSFVTATYMFYLARSLNLFALIPIPTIRSLLSQQVQSSSYGTILTYLQLALKFAGLAYIPAFTKIYQGTLDWFPGCVFMLASVFTVLAMIPISVLGCRSPHRRRYKRIQGD
ncbi:thymic stromal cotransporter homolog [Solea solea]|uniref:thymic stromal cotransporter homolog n=1 Tax=Solea solea TaxID=90069 RepID=UPI00272C4E61|nr:thymic stromal cotransporter homolog [Solea solea]